MHKYFNGPAISTFALSELSLLIVNLDLNLNDSESVMLPLRWYLRYCHRLPNVFTYHWCTLLGYASTLQHVFLDITFILFPPAIIAAAYVLCSTTFIALFTRLYASVYLQRYDFSITVLNWFWVFEFYIACALSFPSDQFSFLNFYDWLFVFSSKFMIFRCSFFHYIFRIILIKVHQ